MTLTLIYHINIPFIFVTADIDQSKVPQKNVSMC